MTDESDDLPAEVVVGRGPKFHRPRSGESNEPDCQSWFHESEPTRIPRAEASADGLRPCWNCFPEESPKRTRRCGACGEILEQSHLERCPAREDLAAFLDSVEVGARPPWEREGEAARLRADGGQR